MSLEGDATNSLGIPKAIFLEDVDKFMKEDNKSSEHVMKSLEELFQKYRVMEISLLQKKEKLKTQIPDIKMSLGIKNIIKYLYYSFKILKIWLDMVLLLKKNSAEKKTVQTDFILAHNLYARAEVPPTDRVIKQYNS